MPVSIPSGINEKALMEVCVLCGIEVDYAIEILSKSDEAFAKELEKLRSPDALETVKQVRQTSSTKEVFDIRRAERGVHRGPAVKKKIYESTVRQMYAITLRATSS